MRDLAAIAAHRGWSTVRVKGEDEFRREMWMQARTLGLEVKGYRPTARDQQELDQRSQAPARAEGRAPAPSRNPRPKSDQMRPEGPTAWTAADYDKGVSGVLLDAGQAPYRRRTGAPLTPFLRIDRGEGRVLDIWGAGLPAALARSVAQTGDAIHVRRDGVDVVQRTIDVRDVKTGATSQEVRDVRRNRWLIDAERFRQATPSQAARDKNLNGAQSHLRVLDTVIDAAVRDPERRARLHAEAREIVADELAQGRRFTPASIREIEPGLTRDVAEAGVRDTAVERARRR